MTRADLLDLVYRYYPRGLYTNSPGYDETEQRRRQVAAARVALAEHPKWKAMIGRLRARYPLVQDWTLHLQAGGVDPAYCGYVWMSRHPPRVLGFHVCFWGPYYGIQRSGTPDEEPHVCDLAREIEATYRCEPIPAELGNTVVPDVAVDGVGMGSATIYTCLLGRDWSDGMRLWM